MNDPASSRQTAEAERDRRRLLALAELGISTTEAKLFAILKLGQTVPPDDLCRRVTSNFFRIGDIAVTGETAGAALKDCFRKGWLQVVDDAALARMKEEVREAGLIGPVYDYPDLGGVDFTSEGSALWLRYGALLRAGREDRRDQGVCWVCVHAKTARYYCSESAARGALEELKTEEAFFAATGPTPIGPWRAEWWRRFPEGYRVDIEDRTRWRGRVGGTWRDVISGVRFLPLDVEQAVSALARHRIELYEWLVMLSLEWRGLHWQAAEEARQIAERFGDVADGGDFQSGIDACLQRKWIRATDDGAVAEVRELLAEDDAQMPVPFAPEMPRDEFDFTEEGARRYRALSADIFGTAWEEGLLVNDAYYCEVHTYCTDIQLATRECEKYADSPRERPRSFREVPIGPWCIYWWERFESGFRVEKTYGDL